MKKLLFWIVLAIPGMQLYGQGCSDAGFCSIGPVKPTDIDSSARKSKNQFAVFLPFGQGDRSVWVWTPALQYTRTFNEHWSLQLKLTGNYASGELGTAIGPGDVFLTGAYNRFLGKSRKWEGTAFLGGKFPLQQSTLQQDGKHLPLQYQSSLGTIDLLTGFSLSHPHWQFAAAYQQPLSGINNNSFLPQYWTDQRAAFYPPGNDFNRAGDVLLRGAYRFKVRKKFSFNAGLLWIYHLREDTYIDANISNEPISIKGSAGTTLNVTLAAWWQLNSQLKLGFTAGSPLIVREVRPDGLTRSFVFAPEISWQLPTSSKPKKI